MFLRLLVILSLVLSATGVAILALQLFQPPGRPRQVARVEAEPAVAPAATGDVAAAQSMTGEADGDLAVLGETFRAGSRQGIAVTPNDRPG